MDEITYSIKNNHFDSKLLSDKVKNILRFERFFFCKVWKKSVSKYCRCKSAPIWIMAKNSGYSFPRKKISLGKVLSQSITISLHIIHKEVFFQYE